MNKLICFAFLALILTSNSMRLAPASKRLTPQQKSWMKLMDKIAHFPESQLAKELSENGKYQLISDERTKIEDAVTYSFEVNLYEGGRWVNSVKVFININLEEFSLTKRASL